MGKNNSTNGPPKPLSTDGLIELSGRLFTPNLRPPRNVTTPNPPALAMSRLPPPAAEVDERPPWRVRRFKMWRDNAPSLRVAVLDPRKRNHLRRYQAFVIPTETKWFRGQFVTRWEPPQRSTTAPWNPSPLVLPLTPPIYNPNGKVAKPERKARYQRLLQYKYALDQEHERRFRQGMTVLMNRVVDFEQTYLEGYHMWEKYGVWKDGVSFGEVMQHTQFFKDIRKKSTNIFHYVRHTNISYAPRRDEVHKAVKAEDDRKERRRAQKERKKQEQEEASKVQPEPLDLEEDISVIQERIRKTQQEIDHLKVLKAQVEEEEKAEAEKAQAEKGSQQLAQEGRNTNDRKENKWYHADGRLQSSDIRALTEEEQKRVDEHERKIKEKRKRQKHAQKIRKRDREREGEGEHEQEQEVFGKQSEPELTDASTISTPSVLTPTTSQPPIRLSRSQEEVSFKNDKGKRRSSSTQSSANGRQSENDEQHHRHTVKLSPLNADQSMPIPEVPDTFLHGITQLLMSMQAAKTGPFQPTASINHIEEPGQLPQSARANEAQQSAAKRREGPRQTRRALQTHGGDQSRTTPSASDRPVQQSPSEDRTSRTQAKKEKDKNKQNQKTGKHDHTPSPKHGSKSRRSDSQHSTDSSLASEHLHPSSDPILETGGKTLPNRVSVTRMSSPVSSSPPSLAEPTERSITADPASPATSVHAPINTKYSGLTEEPSHRKQSGISTRNSRSPTDVEDYLDAGDLTDKLRELGEKLGEYHRDQRQHRQRLPSPPNFRNQQVKEDSTGSDTQAPTVSLATEYRYGSLNMDVDTAAPPGPDDEGPADDGQSIGYQDDFGSATFSGSESGDSYASDGGGDGVVGLMDVDIDVDAAIHEDTLHTPGFMGLENRSLQDTREANFTERDTEMTARPPSRTLMMSR